MRRQSWFLIACAGVVIACSGRVRIPSTGVAHASTGQVAFVRTLPDSQVESVTERVPATELWIADADGSHARRLLTNRVGDRAEAMLTHFEAPAFSPDGMQLYFETDAWVTSGALHVVDLATGTERYVTPANEFEVVPRGAYAGDLLVTQHRYWPAGGSYDWVWLYTPDGKDLGLAASDSTDDALARWKATHIPAR